MNNMEDSKYVYYVECVLGRNSWLSKFLITCHSIDRILPMLIAAGYDSQNAYGEPKEPIINIHHVQKFAKCYHKGPPDGIIEMYRVFCDIKPNDSF